MTATTSTSRCKREDRDDLIAVDSGAVLVDREHAVTVAVECDAEVELPPVTQVLQRCKVGRTAADVDVRAVGLVADRLHLRAELLERAWRDVRIRAVRAIDCDAQAAQIGAEALEDVLEITVDGDADVIDLSSTRSGCIEQRLDLLLRDVAQLAAAAVEELDAVVLRRVVRGRDDDAEVEAEQRHRRCRDDSRKHRGTARRCNATRECLLELLAGGPRVAPDEDPAAA